MSQQVYYKRVSTADQNTARQFDGFDLTGENVKVFEDHASGKNMDRPELTRCLEYVREGDILNVWSIDRLARNLGQLQRTVEELTAKGVVVKFHKENMTFAGKADNMQTLLFQILGSFAEFERAVNRERAAEGIARAKSEGKYRGRKPKLSESQAKELLQMVHDRYSKTEIAQKFGISRTQLYQYIERGNVAK